MKRLLILCLISLCVTWPVAASSAPAGKKVLADLSEDFVGVREGFNGARITVFGVLKSRADVAIVLEGPPQIANVRMKKRKYGIWMNGDARVIAPVPSFYSVISSRPINKIVKKSIAKRFALEPDYLPFGKTPHGGGLVKTKEQQKLYQFSPQGIKILGNKLFRADIQLPANVPIGNFKAHIYEFAGKKIIASRTETLEVAQVGFNESLSRMAHQQPGMYAALCLFLSISIGSIFAYMFRRMS